VIAVAAADGSSNQQIAAELELPAVTVGKWRRCFAAHRLEGWRDARIRDCLQGTVPRRVARCVNSRANKAAGVSELWPRTWTASQHGPRDISGWNLRKGEAIALQDDSSTALRRRACGRVTAT
jgi:hypothetical protein